MVIKTALAGMFEQESALFEKKSDFQFRYADARGTKDQQLIFYFYYNREKLEK